MCSRKDKDYYTSDLISDILSNGDSSRLYTKLVKEQQLFSEINAFISGDFDEGLFIFTGKLIKGVSVEEGEHALNREIDRLMDSTVEDDELSKVKNKIESTLEYSEMSVLNKAMNLSFSEMLGDANLINTEIDKYNAVTKEDVLRVANEIFRKENCSTLYYLSKKNGGN
jgi:predicted Zn-dependent peptidase